MLMGDISMIYVATAKTMRFIINIASNFGGNILNVNYRIHSDNIVDSGLCETAGVSF